MLQSKHLYYSLGAIITRTRPFFFWPNLLEIGFYIMLTVIQSVLHHMVEKAVKGLKAMMFKLYFFANASNFARVIHSESTLLQKTSTQTEKWWRWDKARQEICKLCAAKNLFLMQRAAPSGVGQEEKKKKQQYMPKGCSSEKPPRNNCSGSQLQPGKRSVVGVDGFRPPLWAETMG